MSPSAPSRDHGSHPIASTYAYPHPAVPDDADPCVHAGIDPATGKVTRVRPAGTAPRCA